MEGFLAFGFLGIIIGIICAILCIILFFKVWGMTSDVKTIKYILLDIADKMNSTSNNQERPSEKPVNLEEGDTVVNTETGEELIVAQVFPDGDVACKKSNGFGLRKVVKITNLRKKE